MRIEAMNLIKIHVIRAETPQAVVDGVVDMFSRKTALINVVAHRIKNLCGNDLSITGATNPSRARPSTSSLAPMEYMSAVSKKLMPASNAR